jgi:Signal transduction histidine kinase
MRTDHRLVDWRIGSSRVVRRAMGAYLLLGAVALLVTGSGTYLTSGAVARSDALHDAERIGVSVADLLVRPLLDGALAGEPNQLEELDRALAAQVNDGSIARIWVWDQSGRVRYADQMAMVGRTYPLPRNAAKAIVEDASTVNVRWARDLPMSGQLHATRLVEVILPVQLDRSTRLAMAAYFDYAPVQERTTELTRQMLPMLVAVLAVLQIVQVPIAYSLAVRLSRHQNERARLLRCARDASERERRRIARDLHDGVVADLAGVGYVLSALEKTLPGQPRVLADRAGTVVRDAVRSLRTVMADIYPPDLAGGGLAAAVGELTQPLRERGVDVSVTFEAPGQLPVPVAAALYRFTREALRNVADHSQASTVRVALRHGQGRVLLRVDDNGVGLPSSGIDRRGEGHLGLRLLADSVGELGGRFEVTTSDLGGVSIQVNLPIDCSDELTAG